jgi:hypothetical protein
MVDSVVSVRMPSSLVQRLKELSKANHFLDVSEGRRSVIRHKTKQYKDRSAPKSEKKSEAHDFKTENVVKEELVRRLKKMIEDLEDDKKK